MNKQYIQLIAEMGGEDIGTPGEIADERTLEGKAVSDIKNFIMKMGQGFSFIGNQYRLELAGEEFFIDLLFFNRPLRCLVAFDLSHFEGITKEMRGILPDPGELAKFL